MLHSCSGIDDAPNRAARRTLCKVLMTSIQQAGRAGVDGKG